jgi:hypothetical protein
MLEILYRGTKIEANSRNSVRNHSAKKKTTRNSVPWNKIEANTWNSVPNHSAKEKPTWNYVPWNKNKSKLSEFRSMSRTKTRGQVCLLEQDI